MMVCSGYFRTRRWTFTLVAQFIHQSRMFWGLGAWWFLTICLFSFFVDQAALSWHSIIFMCIHSLSFSLIWIAITESLISSPSFVILPSNSTRNQRKEKYIRIASLIPPQRKKTGDSLIHSLPIVDISFVHGCRYGKVRSFGTVQ